jgi:hypothetical protein
LTAALHPHFLRAIIAICVICVPYHFAIVPHKPHPAHATVGKDIQTYVRHGFGLQTQLPVRSWCSWSAWSLVRSMMVDHFALRQVIGFAHCSLPA